jgi:hypothetical protein
MRATTLPMPRARRLITASVITAVLALTTLGGAALAADSRAFTVDITNPSNVSQGGLTKFDVTFQSGDNQTIANVKVTIRANVPVFDPPATGGVTIETVFGADAGLCPAPSNSATMTCNFGNVTAFDDRSVSILARVAKGVPVSNSITFTASAETNNENGSNVQVRSDTSSPLNVILFDANSVTTAGLTGPVSTDELGKPNAGNLQTRLNLLQDNGGKGNVIVIQESTSAVQPTVCITLKLTCQPDSVDLTVNGGNPVLPYLETVLTAKVPSSYNIKKAFVIHVLTNGQIDGGVALFNSATTSCIAHPSLVPCADFSLTKAGILTITVHTNGNGGMRY